MDLFGSLQELQSWQAVLLAVVLILVLLAVVNHAAARWAERRNPPKGAFIEVDRVRLHYSDRGSGPPILLVHGNVVTGDDYDISGVAERLIGTCRVIIFDRPGFGHSERPRWRPWAAMEQARLLHKALAELGVRRPVVVGHSWGTLVALALAIRYPADTAGLVLLSGYYFPTFRLDAVMVAPGAVPLLGDILRYTISPLFGWLTMPLTKRIMFAPAPVTARFRAEYSTAMALRPSQIRATCVDGTFMVSSAKRLRAHYRALSLPVTIIAGDGDKIVSHRHAERLQAAISGSNLRIVAGAGHMVHHVATDQVAEAILMLTGIAGKPAYGAAGAAAPNPRHPPEA
ncbi:alpha/beta hydrolase [Sphingomonas oleivorans]|uniref:Alpha/beta hydrolase n=1 Tax=Sphingomonas oleivorans TaxID=1735121 RepID=A0A2T5G0E4_9SPHN|nr:alpha/beta hydrolase [Sphingomonas oleivorans]PTQ12396.1 alpha/beta hydrolase [Sphingomonas oleivorans]